MMDGVAVPAGKPVAQCSGPLPMAVLQLMANRLFYSRDDQPLNAIGTLSNRDTLLAKAAAKRVSGKKFAKMPKFVTSDSKRRTLLEAKEFARIESKFGGRRALSEEQIFEHFDHFRYIVKDQLKF